VWHFCGTRVYIITTVYFIGGIFMIKLTKYKALVLGLSCLLGISTAAVGLTSIKKQSTSPVFADPETSIITAEAGDGVSAVYVSSKDDGTELQPSGSALPLGHVYCYAVLEENYVHPSYWVLISGVDDTEGALYRTSSYDNAGVDHDFGVQEANKLSQYVEFYDLYNLLDIVEFVYGETPTLPTPPEKEYAPFLYWCVEFDGSGTAYETISQELNDQIAKEEVEIPYLFAIRDWDEDIATFFNSVNTLFYYGLPELTPEYEAMVFEVYKTYNELSDAEQDYSEVDGFFVEAINGPCLWYTQLALDEIGTIEDTDDFRENLERAQDAYDKFPYDYRDMLDVDDFNDARVQNVIYLIDGIGEIEYSAECKAKVDAAWAAYYNLGSLQDNISAEKYNELDQKYTEYYQLEYDHECAESVEGCIDDIPLPVTKDSEDEIEDARYWYDALTQTQQSYVTNYSVLTDAEATLPVVKLIDAIGELEYSDACAAKIVAAKEAYDHLTEAQKEFVSQTDTEILNHAYTVYTHIVDAVSKIEGIGEVAYTQECKAKIDVARNAYNGLTQEEKSLIPATELKVLTDAEAEYARLTPVDPVDPEEPVAPEEKGKEGLSVGAIVAIAVGGAVAALCGAYFLLFFVFNKWIKVDEDKVVRVFPFALGKKDKAGRYFAFPCKFYYRERSEVYKTKDEALK